MTSLVPTNPIDALLAEKGVLLADGATGTNLFGMGLAAGEAPELWNETAPEKIEALHQNFVDAGADIILTNSFGGTRHRLKLHDAQDRVFELNRKAAEIAWIETMSAPQEARAAAQAAIEVGLPYTYTFSFDTAGRSMMGLPPNQIHGVADGLGEAAVAVGANCGVGASDILASLLDMSEAKPDATIIVKGNCGIPEFRGTEIHYSGTPDLMSDYVRLAVDAGAKIVGGCCGTSFSHLAAMRKALDAHKRDGRPTVLEIVERIGPLRNKTADQSGAGQAGDARRERRRSRG
jgi:5-methyltetrahydrofolate--homocysteine methyltransferase